MRRAICAIYVEIWKDPLYYRKHNGIAPCYFQHVSNNMEKQNPYQSKLRRQRPEPTLASVSSPVYIISVKDSEGIMLGSAHASTTYGM